jgi:hypothetical protein
VPKAWQEVRKSTIHISSTPEGLGDQACHMRTCGKAHNARGACIQAVHSKKALLLLLLLLGCCIMCVCEEGWVGSDGC